MRFVAGVGKTNVDILYGGMPRIPHEGEEIYAKEFSVQLGGGPPATLINVARLDIPVRIQTFLGNDFFSRFAREQYRAYRAEPMNLYDGDGIPVNVTSAVVTARDRAFTSYTDVFDVTDTHRSHALEASRGAAVVLMHEDFIPIYPTLKAGGSILVYDTGWREDMNLDEMQGVFELADWYVPNEMEATRVTGTSSPGAAAKVLSRFFGHVVIKLGSEGCLVRTEGREAIVRSLPNVRAVDTTGAGDAFLAGFVYGLFHGASPLECVLFGNITGATCVESIGCLASYVTEEKLLEKAKQYECLMGR